MIESGGARGMREGKSHGTAFYIETLILAAVFALVALVLTKAFAWSGQLSRKAGILTDAVHLAENAAEAVAASGSLEELRGLLEENGNVRILEEEGHEGGVILRVWHDGGQQPDLEGSLWVDVAWMPQETMADLREGCLAECGISVYWIDAQEPVYELETAVYVPGQ